jgi:hypothetical protein
VPGKAFVHEAEKTRIQDYSSGQVEVEAGSLAWVKRRCGDLPENSNDRADNTESPAVSPSSGG